MKSGLQLSPSTCHWNLARAVRPALSYSGGPVMAWQTKARRKLKELLKFPKGPRAPLRPRQLWRRETELGSIEKIAFTTEPNSDAVAYLCLPRQARPPYPLFICLQGHTSGMHLSIAVDQATEKQSITVEGDRDFAVGCLRRGIAALCLEQRAFGERREQTQEKTAALGCFDATMQALMLGRTLLGERVFDVDRALDYLETRRDIDPGRIGVMGNSSGGAVSLYAAALLPRIALAMPSCYFCTFLDSVMSIYHCEENYIPGLLPQLEMYDIMGLFAPKPVVIVAGKKDPMFPISATRRAFARLQSIYKAAGAKARCHLVVGPEGHRFYADPAWAVMLKELRGTPS